MEELSNFLTRLLEWKGALVEEKGQRIEALVPRDVAQILGTKEYQSFCLDEGEGQPEDIPLNYDSDLIERMAFLIEGKGLLSKLLLPAPPINKEKAEESLKRHLALNNAIYRIGGLGEGNIPYILFNFRYAAVSDEKKEDLISIIVNEATLSTPQEMIPMVEAYLGVEMEVDGGTIYPSRSPEEVYKTALRVMKGRIREELFDFERSMERRLRKDISRLEDYYETIKSEIIQKIEKKHLEGEVKEAEELKIRATELELERRINDQIERYSIRIEARLVNALRIVLPSAILSIELIGKKERREVRLCWNPLLKRVEDLGCEGCGLKGLYLCNALHILCSRCYFKCPQCGKMICLLCHQNRCPRCLRVLKGGVDEGTRISGKEDLERVWDSGAPGGGGQYP